jgi:hypothetical protein
LQRAGWHVVYEERARAWTEAPATLAQLYKQRYRWSYGTMQAMWKHRRAVLDGGPSGRMGRVGLPFLALFGIGLPLVAPVMDILMLYGLTFWEKTETLYAWLGMLLLQLVTAAIAFRFDRESLRPLWTLPLQQLAYRQLMYLVLIQSVMSAMTGARLRWHKLHRTGLPGGTEPARTEPARTEPAGGVAAVPVARAPEHGLAAARTPPPARIRSSATVPAQSRPEPPRPEQAQPAHARPEQARTERTGDPWRSRGGPLSVDDLNWPPPGRP